MNTVGEILAFAGVVCSIFVVVQLLRLTCLKRGTWWAIPYGIGGCVTLFGLAVMLDAVARQAKFDHISISNSEAASLGKIGRICGVGIVVFSALARSGWLNKKLWL